MSEKSIGGLWQKESSRGQYFSGQIEINGEKHNFVAFANDKQNDRQPDYRIFAPKKREPEGQ